MFFVEPRRLTTDSKAGHFTETVPDLYVAELSGGKTLGDPLTYKLKDLTPEGINGESAGVLLNGGKGGGVIGASDRRHARLFRGQRRALARRPPRPLLGHRRKAPEGHDVQPLRARLQPRRMGPRQG